MTCYNLHSIKSLHLHITVMRTRKLTLRKFLLEYMYINLYTSIYIYMCLVGNGNNNNWCGNLHISSSEIRNIFRGI